MAEITRKALLESLQRQRAQISSSIVLTPVDSLPFLLADREHTGFLHGLYLTDKVRDRQTAIDTVIQFAGREAAAQDLGAIHRFLANKLEASEGSLRLLAGLQAHTVVFMSIAAIGQKVMLLPEEAGGHFSTKAILHRLGLQTVDMAIDRACLCVNMEETVRIVEREHPDFIFVDRSEGLRYEDFSRIGQLEGPVKVFDASQYLTPILSRRYANPLEWGYDLMLFTLHKSFPGPQKAGIVGAESGDLWQRLLAGLSRFVSSSHAENSYLFGLALLQEEWLSRYEQRLFDSAWALEERLIAHGINVVTRAEQGIDAWPSTHHIWVRSRNEGAAYHKYEDLAKIGVLTNYRKLPYELGYGLRLGTTYSSVAGLDVEHTEELAEIIHRTFDSGPSAELRRRVEVLAQRAAHGAILPARHWS